MATREERAQACLRLGSVLYSIKPDNSSDYYEDWSNIVWGTFKSMQMSGYLNSTDAAIFLDTAMTGLANLKDNG